MNSPTITRVNLFTKTVRSVRWVAIGMTIALGISSIAFGWEIDLSRRRKNVEKEDAANEALVNKNTDASFFETLLPANPGAQEIVILSTDQGFIPRTVRVKKDSTYTVYVVNVNEKEKNVSFILDAFSEHHGTYFGKIKKFDITPRKEGIYSFLCPETAKEGRMVVYIGEPSGRSLSSQPAE